MAEQQHHECAHAPQLKKEPTRGQNNPFQHECKMAPERENKGAWEKMQAQLNSGKLIVLDGGVGTELQKKGVKLDNRGWSCTAQLEDPAKLQSIHESFLDAGAQITIANNFSTNRCILSALGMGNQTTAAITAAVDIAMKARRAKNKMDTLVVGSVSTMHPSNGKMEEVWPADAEEFGAYVESCTLQAALGVDAIFLEMIKDLVHGPRLIKAAAWSGKPVFMGLSARLRDDGALVMYGYPNGPEVLFTSELVESLIVCGEGTIVGVNVMHTSLDAIPRALQVIRTVWEGLLGVYPDHGFLTMPDWNFEEIDLVKAMTSIREWVTTYNVRIVGGCCGLGPEFVECLSNFAKEWNDHDHDHPSPDHAHAHGHDHDHAHAHDHHHHHDHHGHGHEDGHEHDQHHHDHHDHDQHHDHQHS